MDLSQLYHTIENLLPTSPTNGERKLILQLKTKLTQFEETKTCHLPNRKHQLIEDFLKTIPENSRLSLIIPGLYRALYPHATAKNARFFSEVRENDATSKSQMKNNLHENRGP
jgi:hemerythrin superfamily protein